VCNFSGRTACHHARYPISGKNGDEYDLTQHVCVDPGASWQADFSCTGWRARW
jgi:hypothetical protein